MIRSLLAAALLASAVCAVPAHANDPRLVTRLYDPTQVVTIHGKVDVQTTIRFGKDEKIQNVAIGDSKSWQVTPNRAANLLFVKPLAEHARTNMTVVTNRHLYLFDLVASPSFRHPLYVLSFTYPVDLDAAKKAKEAARAKPPGRADALEMAAATDPYAVIDPATLNFKWKREGAKAVLPTQVYDDGDATFLVWPIGTPMPAILVKNDQGVEGPVNYAVRGDKIVLHGVPRKIFLRAGEDTGELVYAGPGPAPKGKARTDDKTTSEAALAGG